MCKVALKVSTLQVFSLYMDKQQSIFGTCIKSKVLKKKEIFRTVGFSGMQQAGFIVFLAQLRT